MIKEKTLTIPLTATAYRRFTDLGYDYRNHIYEKTVSPEILKNQNNKNTNQ